MATPEFTSRQLKAKLDQRLRHSREKVTQMFSDNKKVMPKYETTRYDEYKKNVYKQCEMLKAMEKLRSRNARLDKLNEVQNTNKTKKLAKFDKLQKQNAEIMEQQRQSQNKASAVDGISEYLGFQVQLKEEDVYTVRFTQLPIKEPGMKFEFDILENVQENTVKVLRCEPSDCLDTTHQLEDQVNQGTKPTKFFELSLWIRKKLIDKYT